MADLMVEITYMMQITNVIMDRYFNTALVKTYQCSFLIKSCLKEWLLSSVGFNYATADIKATFPSVNLQYRWHYIHKELSVRSTCQRMPNYS